MINFVKEPVMRVFLMQEKRGRQRERLWDIVVPVLILFHSGKLMSLVCDV